MKRIVGLWVALVVSLSPVFSQVDTSYIYNTAMPYGTLDLRVAKSATRYYYLQEDKTFSFRESAPGVKTNTFNDMTSWDSSPYKQGNLREKNGNQDLFVMNYRILFPQNYDPNYDPGYPIIIMLHGYGERGNCWNNNCYWNTTSWNPNTNSPPAPTSETHNLLNNDHSLLHGGQKHLTAVNLAGTKKPDDPTLNPTAFPGIVLFPQAMNGWQQTARVEEAIKLLRLVIKKYNIDENRVYIHALSNGGGGLYQAIKRAPWLFAAALPMSAVSDGGIFNDGLAPEVGKIPLWAFQGGKDTNPTPSKTYSTVRRLREAGGSVRYYLYPHLGHGTWNSAYNEPDFFSWILEKRKYNPHVYYGNPVICNTTAAGVRISFSNGFKAYQWEQDGAVVNGAANADFVANTPGTYRGRFSRVSNPTEADWEQWSDPIVVTEISPAKPTIEALTSTHLRGPGLTSTPQNNTVILKSQQEAELYTWYKNGVVVDFPGTDVNDTLRTASFTSSGTGANGTYTMRTSFSYCQSPLSDPVQLFFANSATQNMTFTAATANFHGVNMNGGVFLSWNDLVTNETAYEIWRRKAGTTTFEFAGRSPKNAISFFDGPLEPSTTYQYKIRAVGNSGSSNYVPSNDLAVNYEITTPGDTSPPSSPQDLKVTLNTISSITLSWKPAADNTGVKSYVITYGNQEISTDTSLTTFTIEGLSANTIYPITVKAKDFAGNISQPSNQIIASTYVVGLFYKHSTGGWEDLDDPTLIATFADPEFTGTINNFSLNPRTQEDFFNFQFTGYIDIPANGKYLFRLTSNDGGRLYLDNALAIENNGVHGNVTKFSDTLTLVKGPHWLELQYFDYVGAQTLTLQYKGPDLNVGYKAVPDSLLRSGKYIAPVSPPVPSSLVATSAGIQQIDLSWTANGYEVEVYRSLTSSGNFIVIGKSAGGTLSDNTALNPGTTYYYKVRTISPTGLSAFSVTVSAATSSDSVVPTVPTDVAVTTKSHTQIALSWTASTDNAGVDKYEVYVNGTLNGSSQLTSYTIAGLDPSTAYDITVKAVDASNNRSAASSVLTVTTNPSAIFYSIAAGNLNALSTWKQNINGTGNSPTDFSENGQYFVVANRTSTGLGGALDISAPASKLIVPTGVTLTTDFNFSGRMELEGNAVLNLNSESIPEFVKISPTSTVNFNTAVNVPAFEYGSIGLTGTGFKSFDAGTTTIHGNLTVANGLVLKGAAANASLIVLDGNLTINGTLGSIASDNRIALELTSASPQVSSSGNVALYSITSAENATVTVTSASVSKITLGSLNGGGLLLKNNSNLNLNRNSLSVIGAGTINPTNTNGNILMTNGNLVISSSSDQSSNIYFSSGAHTIDTLKATLSGAGKVIVKSNVDIRNALIVDQGELNAGGFITLLSTVNESARIPEVKGLISGEVNVQKYIPYIQDQWIDLSSPVAGVTIADWQNYFPVTGSFTGSTPGQGTDASVLISDGASLVAYPPAGGSNTAAIVTGKGYRTKMKVAAPVTLIQSGNVNQGDVNVPLTGGTAGDVNTGWNLSGNPYASPIVWSHLVEAWTRTGVNANIAVQENKVISGSPVTQYQYHNALLPNPSIAAGQGFWVKTFNATPSLVIHEKAKEGIFANDTALASYFTVSMIQGDKTDKTYFIFTSEATENFDDPYDGVKKHNEGIFNLSSVSSNIQLAVNALSDGFCSVSVNLNITDAPAGSYALKFSDLSLLNGLGFVTLVDHFTNTTQAITGSDYTFSITSDPASTGGTRFTITFSRMQLDITTPQASAAPACGEGNAIVVVTNSQESVQYAAVNASGSVISEIVMGTGDDIQLEIPVSALAAGDNAIRIQAGFDGCSTSYLNSTATLNYTDGFTVQANDVSVCVGDQATLQAAGVPAGGSYKWYDDLGVQIPGQSGNTLTTDDVDSEISYQVSGILANGCESDLTTVHVYADTLEMPSISVYQDTLFTQVEASYQWYRNGNVIQNATASYFVPQVTGFYTVVASKNGCSKTSSPYEHVIDPGCQLNTASSDVTTESVCGADEISVSIANSLPTVIYTIIDANDQILSSSEHGNNGTLVLIVSASGMSDGANHLRVKAELEGCINRTLDKEIDIINVVPFEIEAPAAISVCNNTAAMIEATGAPEGGHYAWYNADGTLISGISGSTLTTLPITTSTTILVAGVHASGCEGEKKSVVITPVVVPTPLISSTGGTLTTDLLGNYQWVADGSAIDGANGQAYTPIISGAYTVEVEQNGCSATSAVFNFVVTGVDDASTEFVLSTYPVPSSSTLFRYKAQSPSTESILVTITDMTGKKIFSQWFIPKELSSGNSLPYQLSDGVYSMVAKQGREEVRKKIVIKN